MPIVGITSSPVTRLATSAGTISSTTANAPAACKASASSMSRSPASPRPWMRNPPSACSDCGVKPRCAITGMPDCGHGLDVRREPRPALQLDRVRAALLHEPDRGREGLLGAHLVAAERQIGHHQRRLRAPYDGLDQRHQLVDRHRDRVVVAVHVVGRRIADEQHRDARLVEDLRGVHVVGGEHRPPLPALLHLPQVVDPRPLGLHGRAVRRVNFRVARCSDITVRPPSRPAVRVPGSSGADAHSVTPAGPAAPAWDEVHSAGLRRLRRVQRWRGLEAVPTGGAAAS